MSVDYAAGLSYYEDLGVCGLDEVFDSSEVVKEKVKLLADWLRQFKGSCIIHAGAGLSTAAGIRDFRGKGGVWTELQGKSPCEKKADSKQAVIEEKRKATIVKPFDETTPTFSHLALKALCESNYVKHIVSQNVDGLFLKSNLSRCYISELHGNFYLDECTKCRSRFIRSTASKSMRLQKSSVKCPRNEDKACRGQLRDTILDWESPIPYNELRVATRESKLCKLHICIGTSLQLRPSKDLVCKPNNSNKLVMINLQPTNFDKQANLVINYYADDVLKELTDCLDLHVPSYDITQDPTKRPECMGTRWQKKSFAQAENNPQKY